MRRRDLVLCSGAAFAWPVAARAQTPPAAIGFLSARSAGESGPYVAAFRHGLGSAGYVEGQNAAIRYGWAESDYNRLPALAAALVAHGVDVIARFGGTPAARAAKRATSTIPIVFFTGGDPVEEGLIASLARPGGNLTGVSFLAQELNPKRLELLLELVPRARAIAMLVNPKFPQIERTRRDVEQAALVKGVRLHVVEAGTDADLEAAFASLVQSGVGGLLVGSDPFLSSREEQIMALATHVAVPAIYQWPESAAAGGLVGYGPSLAGSYQQVGVYVGRILKGAKPADLPVQQPVTFELVINLKAAKALGLTVPQSLLARADEVIE